MPRVVATPSDRMKRTRSNTRARLLAAASTVFSESGFQAATVEDVCSAAGFTRGAFYSNFTSKDELFLALWDVEALRVPAAAEALAARRASLRSAVGTLIDVLLASAGLRLPPDVDLDLFTRMVIATHEGSQHQSLVEPEAAGPLEPTMIRDLLARCTPPDRD
jgi:AcrR family transcriptional regulator